MGRRNLFSQIRVLDMGSTINSDQTIAVNIDKHWYPAYQIVSQIKFNNSYYDIMLPILRNLKIDDRDYLAMQIILKFIKTQTDIMIVF
jgi:hypothetical protein